MDGIFYLAIGPSAPMCLLHRKHWLFCVDRLFRAAALFLSLSALVCWGKSRFISIVVEVTTSTSTTTTLSSSVSLSLGLGRLSRLVCIGCQLMQFIMAFSCHYGTHTSTNRLIMAVNFHFGFWCGSDIKAQSWNELKMQYLHKNSWHRPIWSWTLWS